MTSTQGLFMAIPKIIVISLKNSTRRENIAKRLSGFGLDFTFFDAADGKKLPASVLEYLDYNFSPKYYLSSKSLTLGEIDCAISHIKVYEHMVENNIKSAIILEDDAIVSQHFKEIVEDTLNKNGKVKSHFFKKRIVEGYRLAHYKSPSKNSRRCIIYATAYLITLSGAKKLLNYAYPIRLPADYLTGLIQKTRVDAYGIEPPCVFRGLNSDSEIDKIEHRYE